MTRQVKTSVDREGPLVGLHLRDAVTGAFLSLVARRDQMHALSSLLAAASRGGDDDGETQTVYLDATLTHGSRP